MEAFKLDGLVESHPIEVEISHTHEIDEIFDAISYKKGGSIICMLENYLGAHTFRKGLVSYVKRYTCKNAKTEDLWAVLLEESGESVKELMDSWTKRKGYPVVYAKLKGNELELEQSHFWVNVHSSREEIPIPNPFYLMLGMSLGTSIKGIVDPGYTEWTRYSSESRQDHTPLQGRAYYYRKSV